MLSDDQRKDALVAALAEIERYVTSQGWEQAARLFALVSDDLLAQADPGLAPMVAEKPEGSLSAIEQEGFHDGDDLALTLSRIGWPEHVSGCALAVERSFLPSEREDEVPDDPALAAHFVAHHPERKDVRVVVGALRGGVTFGLARLVDEPEELLGAQDLVPGLAHALLGTLELEDDQ